MLWEGKAEDADEGELAVPGGKTLPGEEVGVVAVSPGRFGFIVFTVEELKDRRGASFAPRLKGNR